MTSLRGNRDFTLLLVSDAANQMGTTVRTTVIPLVAVTTLAASEFEIGLLAASATAAFLLIGLPAGVWVDRLRRRPVLIAANAFRAGLLMLIPLAALAGWLSIPMLIAIALLTGAGTVFFDVAALSLLPSVVRRDQLPVANGRLHTAQAAGRLTGPGLGGLLAQLLGAANGMWASVVLYGGSALALSRIGAAESQPPRPAKRNMRAELAEGARFVLGHPLMRALSGFAVTWNFFLNLGFSMHVLLLARTLGLPAAAVGVLIAVPGVGSVLGAASASWWIGRLGLGRAMLLLSTLGAAGGVLIALGGGGWRLAVFVIGQLALGYGGAIYGVAQVTCRQSVCPDHMLGRVIGIARFLSWGAIPLGLLAGGLTGQLFGVYGALWVSAAGGLLAVLWLTRAGQAASSRGVGRRPVSR